MAVLVNVLVDVAVGVNVVVAVLLGVLVAVAVAVDVGDTRLTCPLVTTASAIMPPFGKANWPSVTAIVTEPALIAVKV